MKTTKRDQLVQKICNLLLDRFASEEYSAYVFVSHRLGVYALERGVANISLSEYGQQGQEMFRKHIKHSL